MSQSVCLCLNNVYFVLSVPQQDMCVTCFKAFINSLEHSKVEILANVLIFHSQLIIGSLKLTEGVYNVKTSSLKEIFQSFVETGFLDFLP